MGKTKKQLRKLLLFAILKRVLRIEPKLLGKLRQIRHFCVQMKGSSAYMERKCGCAF